MAGHDDSPARAARRPSLFERVTGTGRARKPSDTPEMQHTQAVPVAPQTETQTRQEPRFEGVDEKPAPQPTRADEDMLEIPAFLRRQAN